MTWNQFIGITTPLYALSNPVGAAIPMFMMTARDADIGATHLIVILASTAVAILLLSSAILGRQCLNLFNAGLDDSRIFWWTAGFGVASDMFHGTAWKAIQPIDSAAREEAAIHGFAITPPSAFPLLVGPAEMSITITLSNDNVG